MGRGRDEQRAQRLARALEGFITRWDGHSYRRMMNAEAACSRAEGAPPEGLKRRVQAAVLAAAESANWRLAREAISDLWLVEGAHATRADMIVQGLFSKRKSVRSSSSGAVRSVRLSRLVLDRLEARPIREVMTWEVLEAIGNMAHYLTSERDWERLVGLVKRMKARVDTLPKGRRGSMVAWKIDDTLYSDFVLRLPREGREEARRARLPLTFS